MNEVQKAMLLSQISRVRPEAGNSIVGPTGTPRESTFEKILEKTELSFSKHAEKRLQSRGIEISDATRAQLDGAVGSLEKKGARDSLVLMGELAFIVNVPSRTVVTAMTKDQMQEQVFTNIDSTMLVKS